MQELFYMGGIEFMSILTILLVLMTAWIIYHLVMTMMGNIPNDAALRKVSYGRSIGLFAFITGIFGQLIGLYEALKAIENAGDISPSLVFAGLKVSMITTLYGFSIYLFSLMLWFVATFIIEKRMSAKVS